MAAGANVSDADLRFMAAAIRLARRHKGLTGTNPSVATLVVAQHGSGPAIIGRGITALGGRPHAEPQALEEAGDRARGATAYVTLEPCAHHGRTPPCAEALIAAGIARVVGAASDPDPRVSGKGYAMLREAGIEVVEGVLAGESADDLAGYLTRSVAKRPEVTLKLAVSADGMIGVKDHGHVTVTGEVSRAQVHVMRAQSDAILVGIGTALADDPQLTCRLPGLEARSPERIVIDRLARLPATSKLVRSARKVPLRLAVGPDADDERRAVLAAAGVEFLACDVHEGHVALPEFLEDLGARGMSTLMIEGGAITAAAFLDQGLVDRICLFCGKGAIGGGGVRSPLTRETIPPGFRLLREAAYGDDTYCEWIRAG